jgi:hypothetical protein
LDVRANIADPIWKCIRELHTAVRITGSGQYDCLFKTQIDECALGVNSQTKQEHGETCAPNFE